MPEALVAEQTTQPRSASLDQLISARAATDGGRRFLWTPRGELSYRDAEVEIESLAVGLQNRGIGVGDRVALFMETASSKSCCGWRSTASGRSACPSTLG